MHFERATTSKVVELGKIEGVFEEGAILDGAVLSYVYVSGTEFEVRGKKKIFFGESES